MHKLTLLLPAFNRLIMVNMLTTGWQQVPECSSTGWPSNSNQLKKKINRLSTCWQQVGKNFNLLEAVGILFSTMVVNLLRGSFNRLEFFVQPVVNLLTTGWPKKSTCWCLPSNHFQPVDQQVVNRLKVHIYVAGNKSVNVDMHLFMQLFTPSFH